MKKIKLLLAAVAATVTLGANAQIWTGNKVAEGEFYLYNIGTGQYLSSNNSWGTQASLVTAGGFLTTLEAQDNGYAIQIPETHTNKKAGGPGYLGSNGFVDGEDPTPFTFTQAERNDGVIAYHIQAGTNNLAYSGTGTVLTFNTETGDNAQWVLVSKADRLAAMANADAGHPVDATFLLQNADFGRYRLPALESVWTWTFPGSSNKNNAGDNTNFCVESFHVAFDFSQTIVDAPSGLYAVRGQAFYRQDGEDSINLPFFYVGDSIVTFLPNTGNEASMSAASTSFLAGNYFTGWSNPAPCLKGGLKVGAHLDNNTALWCIWDNIQIQYYGGLKLEDYNTLLNQAVAAAQAYQAQIPEAAYALISDAIDANNQSYDNADSYEAAITAINKVVTETATPAIIDAYAHYKEIKANALALLPTLDTTEADTEVEAATTAEEVTSGLATLRLAVVEILPTLTIEEGSYIDLTKVLLDNPTVRQNTNYWTAVENGSQRTNGSWAVTNFNETEFYQQNFKFFQTLQLPIGTFEFGVTGFHRDGNHSTYFYAGEDRILIPGVANTVVNSMDQAEKYFEGGKGTVALKFSLEEDLNELEIGIINSDTETDKWTIFRDFTLHYFGPYIDLAKYEADYTEAVAAAQAALDSVAYAVVTGVERANVEAALDADKGDTKGSILAAINGINDAVKAFTDATSAYNNFNSIKASLAAVWGEDVLEGYTATSAEQANKGYEVLYKAVADYVAANYQFSLTSKIGEFNTWTAKATSGGEDDVQQTLSREHWSGQTHTYYEQGTNGWDSTAWTLLSKKEANLPVGNYVLKVAARGSVDTEGYMTASITNAQVTLPNRGAATKGITLAGEASYDEGEFANNGAGFGWEWRFLPFTVSQAGEVTLTISLKGNKQHNWASLADAELLSDVDLTTKVTLAEDEDVAATIAANNGELATVTLERTLAAGLNTIVLPFDLTESQVKNLFGAAAVVYNFSENSADAQEVTVNFTSGNGTIAANTPVLVKVTEVPAELVAEGVTIKNGEAVVAGKYVDFVGVYAPATVEAGNYFVNGSTLYRSTGLSTVNSLRAIIAPKAEVANVKLVIDGITTGIRSINGLEAQQGVIYNIAGQRVAKAQKGLYIIGGKKVIK